MIVHDSSNHRQSEDVRRIAYLRSQGVNYAAITERLAQEFPDQKPLSKNAVAAIEELDQ